MNDYNSALHPNYTNQYSSNQNLKPIVIGSTVNSHQYNKVPYNSN